MPDLKNSKRSRSSKTTKAATPGRGPVAAETLVVFLSLAALSALAVWWVSAHGYTLYYGDAESHLDTARRVLDSRTPGYDQLGSPWLPLPHVLMLPFIMNDGLWRSGLAGAIPTACCFVLAGVLFYLAVRLTFDSRAAGLAAVGALALNPNILYLQAIPMNEAAMYAGACGMLLATVWFRRTQSVWAVAAAGMFSIAASLSRYEGWILIPLVTIYFLVAAEQRRLRAALVFGLIASLAPVYWLANNYYFSGDALDFYRGPYSAIAINQRALDAGAKPYPGDHDWGLAFLYYRTAAQLCAGTALAVIGVTGLLAGLFKRAWWPVLFLLAPCIFYVRSMYSAGTPIFVPGLYPNSYYNTRYGAIAILLLAFGVAAWTAIAPERWRGAAAATLVLVGLSPWLVYPRADGWICWKESEVNSVARRAWTTEAANYLKANRRPGEGVFTSLGDLAGVFREAGIPMREILHEGNNPEWMAAAARPSLMLHEEWAVAIAGDTVASAMDRVNKKGLRYRLVRSIEVKDAPVVLIYKRN